MTFFRVVKLTRLEAWLTSASTIWLVGAQYKHRLIYRCEWTVLIHAGKLADEMNQWALTSRYFWSLGSIPWDLFHSTLAISIGRQIDQFFWYSMLANILADLSASGGHCFVSRQLVFYSVLVDCSICLWLQLIIVHPVTLFGCLLFSLT